MMMRETWNLRRMWQVHLVGSQRGGRRKEKGERRREREPKQHRPKLPLFLTCEGDMRDKGVITMLRILLRGREGREMGKRERVEGAKG